MKMQSIFVFLILLVSCFPVFKGEGDELKSVRPGPQIGPVNFANVEMVYKKRNIRGHIFKDNRKSPEKFVRVCLMDKMDMESGCSSTDSLGYFQIEEHLREGIYFMRVKVSGLFIQKEIRLENQDLIDIDLYTKNATK